jgi:hypothetical protein
MTAKAAIIGAAVAALLLAAALTRHGPDDPPATTATPTPPMVSMARPPSSNQPAPPAPQHLLPVTLEEISRAAELARQFLIAYGTYRFDETPEDYVNRLVPMMSNELRQLIEQSAHNGALLAQRRRDHLVATAQARLDGTRMLTDGSIIFLLTGTQHLTAGSASRAETARYAVTLADTDNGDWTVTAVELAAIGDTGDGP